MWALADCNSFFCSVEKAFHPGLEGKPVCVLSSNDGNIVALTPEAKALGLRRGDPVFKVRDIISHGGVRLFSTNMMLYEAMSRRVTNILRKSIHHVENYSIDTTEVIAKQSICTSRSFGNMVTELSDLKASVASFASSCANKLRGQRSLCRSVTVFITSNRFREDLPQYGNAQTITLPIPTADTLEITKIAIEALCAIYRKGIQYKKSGVILGEITSDRFVEQSLFDNIKNRPQRHQLMRSIDEINQRYGTKTIFLGVEGIDKQSWTMKCEQRTPNYLTDIKEIMTIEI